MKLSKLLFHEFHFFMAVPALIWQLLFFYIPALLVLIFSVIKPLSSVLFPVFTAEHYIYFMSPVFLLVIARSLMLGLVTAILCLITGYPLAYCLAVKAGRYKNLLLFFLILPFWTSLMVQVYAWFFVLEHDGLINTLLMKLGLINQPLHLLNTLIAIYVVMVYCYLPFMIFPLYSAIEKINPALFEAAADLGATQWQTFVRVTIPLSWEGIKTGFFLVFVPSFGEFVVPTLLGGGKQLFVGSLITQYFLYARNPYLGAAFTVISCLALVVVVGILYWYFERKKVNHAANTK